VIQIYEFLGEKETSEILATANTYRMNKPATKQVELQAEVVQRRTSVNSWVPHEALPKLEKKIELLTGLQVGGQKDSESLHIVEYVSGRWYFPHTDALRVNWKLKIKNNFSSEDIRNLASDHTNSIGCRV